MRAGVRETHVGKKLFHESTPKLAKPGATALYLPIQCRGAERLRRFANP